MNGKGSAQRPTDMEAFRRNWDLIEWQSVIDREVSKITADAWAGKLGEKIGLAKSEKDKQT